MGTSLPWGSQDLDPARTNHWYEPNTDPRRVGHELSSPYTVHALESMREVIHYIVSRAARPISWTVGSYEFHDITYVDSPLMVLGAHIFFACNIVFGRRFSEGKHWWNYLPWGHGKEFGEWRYALPLVREKMAEAVDALRRSARLAERIAGSQRGFSRVRESLESRWQDGRAAEYLESVFVDVFGFPSRVVPEPESD